MKSISSSYRLAGIFLAILFLSMVTNASAKRDIPDNNLAYPVLFIGADGLTGSGFYLADGDSTYFVTARHVLFESAYAELGDLPKDLQIPSKLLYGFGYNKTKKILTFDGVMTNDERSELVKSAPKSELFRKAVEELYQKSQHLQLHSDSVTLLSYGAMLSDSDLNEFIIDLSKLLARGYIKYHHSADVAVVKIGISTKSEEGVVNFFDGVQRVKGPGIVALGRAYVKSFSDALVGNSIYAFGYPTSVSQNPLLNIRLPLLRRGIVAGKNVSLKTIILDAPMYYGNSGGLIIEVENVEGETRFRGIGIVSNLIPFQLSGESGFQNSGYSVVVPMDFVLELLTSKGGLE